MSGSQRLPGVLLAVLLVLALPARAEGTESSAQTLAPEYSPVLSLEPQAKACGAGEAYWPTSVAIVLGRQDVLLRDPHGNLVKHAPTSHDLWGLEDGYYIDSPAIHSIPAAATSTNSETGTAVGRRVSTRTWPPIRCTAVQYWFYYTFNDFTDKHESDWEMAQVDFAAPTPAAALRGGAENGPGQLTFSQRPLLHPRPSQSG